MNRLVSRRGSALSAAWAHLDTVLVAQPSRLRVPAASRCEGALLVGFTRRDAARTRRLAPWSNCHEHSHCSECLYSTGRGRPRYHFAGGARNSVKGVLPKGCFRQGLNSQFQFSEKIEDGVLLSCQNILSALASSRFRASGPTLPPCHCLRSITLSAAGRSPPRASKIRMFWIAAII